MVGEPGVDEGRDLVAPQAPAVGEAVQEHDRWPLPRHLVLDAHTAHVDAHDTLLARAPVGATGVRPPRWTAARRGSAPVGGASRHRPPGSAPSRTGRCRRRPLRRSAATRRWTAGPGGSRGPGRPRTAGSGSMSQSSPSGSIRLASDLGIDLRQAVTVEVERGAVPGLDDGCRWPRPTPRSKAAGSSTPMARRVSRRARPCIMPMRRPASERRVGTRPRVGHGGHPGGHGLAVHGEAAVTVLDLGHHHDPVLEGLAVEPVGGQGQAAGRRRSSARRGAAPAWPCPPRWRSPPPPTCRCRPGRVSDRHAAVGLERATRGSAGWCRRRTGSGVRSRRTPSPRAPRRGDAPRPTPASPAAGSAGRWRRPRGRRGSPPPTWSAPR